jgi:branched-chain amino acid transport system substrate-binding protein
VKIAVLGPFTGDAAFIGQEQLNWAKLAVQDFNEASGWNVELVEGDTQLDAALAVTVAESVLADDAVFAVVGPAGSQEVRATAELFEEASLVYISGSATNPDLTQGEEAIDTFFRTVPTDDVQGPTDANYIFNELGATKLFIIDDQTSYSTGLADQAEAAFEAAGGEIVGRESVTQDDTDFSSLATLIGSAGAEVVFFPGQIASQGALLSMQLQEQGIDTIVFGADGFQSGDFVAGGANEGSYVSSFAPDIHGLESSAEAVARYEEEFGEFVTTFGPPTYAATTIVLEAMQRAFEAGDLSREAVLAEMANTNQEMSVLGIPISFDENHDIVGASFYIFQVQGGEFVLIPTEPAEATPEETPAA